MTLDVRPARRDEWGAAAQVLAAAFVDDPVIRWLSPEPAADVAVFRCMIRSRHYVHVDLALEDGRPVGAALWDPPGHRVPRWRELLALPRWATALRTRTARGLQLDARFEKAFPEQPYWYLASIGAVRRGAGIGGALLRHRLGQIEDQTYLECSKATNVGLYESFGFVKTGEIALPGGPTPATMIRPAGPPG